MGGEVFNRHDSVLKSCGGVGTTNRAWVHREGCKSVFEMTSNSNVGLKNVAEN